jgi:hypothetical protein
MGGRAGGAVSNPCVIIEVSDADQWEPRHGCKVIPSIRQATVLHPSREVAEAEAMRLQARRPGRLFAVFEAVSAATSAKVPTHITLGGAVVAERQMPTLVELGEYDIPF